MILFGFDPGFASIGYAAIGPISHPRVLEFGVFETQKSNKKKNVLSVDDNLRRLFEISRFLRQLLARNPNCVAFCAEAMSFPRSASVAAKMAFTWGALGSLSEATRIPILQASPQEIKKTICGVKTATKEEIQRDVVKLYPEVEQIRAPIPEGKWEHCHDALAVAHMMLDSDLVKILQRRS